MKTPWSTTLAVTVFPNFWHDQTNGRALLQFGRLNHNDDPNVRYRVVAEADGEVLEAFLQVNPQNMGCELMDADLRDGRFLFSVLGDSWNGPIGGNEGFIAGEAGNHAPKAFKAPMDPGLHRAWRVSSSWLFEWRGALTAHDGSMTAEHSVYAAADDPEKMPIYGVVASGPAAFVQVGMSGYSGIMSWTEAAGLKPLLRWPGDWTQGAGNFNTDGVHMVWTHGTGKPADATLAYPVRSIMTAPFTTEPAVASSGAKRLRSDPGQLTPYPFGVGCGYAARTIWSPGSSGSLGSNDLLIVRISDGYSWIISGPPLEEGAGLGFSRALGASCTHVYASATFSDEPNTIVRVRIDSLGAGTPPD